MKMVLKKMEVCYNRKRDIFHVILIALIITVVFWPAHKLRFLHGWDDQWAIFNYFTEDGFTWVNIYSILTTFYFGQYAPVNQLYYTLMYHFFNYDPMYYHIGGVIIHIINAGLLYYLLLHISNRISGTVSPKNSYIALTASTLFAVSPFNLEPVAWVAATKVTLYALFYFLAIHSYCRYLYTSRNLYFYLTLFLFTISFGAKEQAVTLPLCLLLIDYVYKRNLKSKVVILEKLPFFILSLLFGVISIQSQGKGIFEVSEFYALYQRVILSSYTLSEYFTKTLLPVNISYLYPFPLQIGDPVPVYLWIYPVAVVFMAYAYYKLQARNVWLNFGLLFFIIHVILVINILSLARFSIVADRYAYVATSGLYFVLAYIIVSYISHFKKTVFIATVLYFAYFAIYTNRHIKVWTNAVTVKQKLKIEIRNRADYERWKNEHLNK